MKKYAKITNDETKEVSVGLGTNAKFYQSIGFAEMEVEQSSTGRWYLKGSAPKKPDPTIAEQNEIIRDKREKAYQAQADTLKHDYDEALARGENNAEELKEKWLSEKDKIRAENPYIKEVSTNEQ